MSFNACIAEVDDKMAHRIMYCRTNHAGGLDTGYVYPDCKGLSLAIESLQS